MTSTPTVRNVSIGDSHLPGELVWMPQALGLVIFAHGGVGSRHSARHRFVADVMQAYRFGTLLFDLLTEREAGEPRNSFDIPLLGNRLQQALDWARDEFGPVPAGLFGASTGAAAAFSSAARQPAAVAAVVSRGGRPDLAAGQLARVRAPSLLIVGGLDADLLALNRHAMRAMHCQTRFEVVPGASQGFDEPGAIETVAHLAGSWFEAHMRAGRPT